MDSVPPAPPQSARRMGKRRRRPSSRARASTGSGGAKRSRTADHGTRDWSCIGEGPASLIAERVLADDVAAYVFFRAVCRTWRLCCDDPRTLRGGGGVLEDPRLRPRRWIMLREDGEKLAAPHCCRRRFLNVSTGQCIQVDVPELLDHSVLPSTAADGLLFLLSKATGNVRLLNPLTRQAADLPPLPNRRAPYLQNADIPLSGGLVDDRTIWLRDTGGMAFARPGDRRWVLRDNLWHSLRPNVFFAGRLYGLTNGAIQTLDMNPGDGQPPRLVDVASQGMPGINWREKTLHLVDNGGKLVLVNRTFGRVPGAGGHTRAYRVYQVDLEARKVKTRGGAGLGLGGHAVFIGRYAALSVSPQAFPSIEANTIYPGIDLCERGGSQQIGAYRIRDRSRQSFGYDMSTGLSHPWTIADCLATYVSRP